MTKTNTKGKIILFEGGDFTGKTVTAKYLADKTGAIYFHSPSGNTPTAKELYDTLRANRTELTAPAKRLMMLAGNIININAMNALKAAGFTVIADRSMLSNLVYQDIGTYEYHQLDTLIGFPKLDVDLVFLFTADPVVLRKRYSERHDKDSMDADFVLNMGKILDAYQSKWGALYPYSSIKFYDTTDSFLDDACAYCLTECRAHGITDVI